jgi:hypothetical protein
MYSLISTNALSHTLSLFFYSSSFITTMANIKILSLHFNSKSLIFYPPSIVTKELQPSSTTLITPVPRLFTPTFFNIGSIQPCPKPYPPTMHHAINIVVQQFRFGCPHPHMPHNIWHITICSAQLLHNGMRVNIRGYGMVNIWGIVLVFLFRVGTSALTGK